MTDTETKAKDAKISKALEGKEWKTAVVIDNGSGTLRAGLSGDRSPSSVIPSVVGYSKVAESSESGSTEAKKDVSVGKDALKNRSSLELKYPVQHGIVTDWDAMEKLWHYTFYNALRVAPEEHPVLLTEPPYNIKASREKTAQIMFEKFNVPALYMATQAVLGLYSAGRLTGVVLDSGEGVTHSVPVVDGYALLHGVLRLDIGGAELNAYLARLLKERGFDLADDTVRNIKEKLGYVALDHAAEMKKSASLVEKKFELPDGKSITVGNERFLCSEALFQPDLLGLESVGVPQTIHQSIAKCDIDVRKSLYQNVVLSGGNTLFEGFVPRLEKELKSLAPASTTINVVASATRNEAVWYGGSLLAPLPDFQKMWITKQTYEETGVSIIHTCGTKPKA